LPFAAVPAQDDVLTVERQDDLRAHAAAVRLLKKTRIPLVAEELSAKQLCRVLTAATGDKLTFVCSNKVADAAPTLSVSLTSASLWSILSIAQVETGLHFVFRHGVVFVVPADEVKPLTYLRMYDLRGHFMPLKSFPGPELTLSLSGDERPLFPEEVVTDQTVSGFTAEGVEALLVENVQPDSWAREGVSMTNLDGLFLIRQTPRVHREIETMLVRVGLVAPVRVVRAVPGSRPLGSPNRRPTRRR
jgi:hypothetical protein